MSQEAGKRTYHGEDEAEIAYKLQVLGAREGAIKGTVIGGTLMALYPWVQRQTLAGKAFLVMWATIFGMVTHADHYLLQYEAEHRVASEKWRTQARNELAAKGIVPSETAMRHWKSEYDNKLRSTLDSTPAPSTTTPTAGNVAIEQSKILKELDLGKKKEEEKGGVL
ncbi:uncharacterized protein JCM6883_006249 [Sporobolomyces salmoneus]|uniref:uncharacterized protein n=1 Tax=Sporobolomyces salmoneus TaxID=183962 RepID=UPI0031799012